MSFDQRARVLEILLAELDNLADWIDEGEPGFVPPLSPDDVAFWRNAEARGMEVPDDVKARLP